METNDMPIRNNLSEILKNYDNNVVNNSINNSKQNINESNFNKETDPDLIITHEIIKLPSKGLFYSDGLSEVEIEYMTSKDEDLITTPSLIENGTALDILLKRKIKTKNVNPENLLLGDRSALLIFLRTSSYGNEYTVNVTDPRTGNEFKSVVDLSKLNYKEITESPDNNGHFTVTLPMRKKIVKFRLITVGEDIKLYKKAESIKEAYNEDFNQYPTLKLKSHIVSIDGNENRSYIDRFVDAMPALDALTIRRKITEVSPDIDMNYEFTAKDGFKFTAKIGLGIDFFFPNI